MNVSWRDKGRERNADSVEGIINNASSVQFESGFNPRHKVIPLILTIYRPEPSSRARHIEIRSLLDPLPTLASFCRLIPCAHQPIPRLPHPIPPLLHCPSNPRRFAAATTTSPRISQSSVYFRASECRWWKKGQTATHYSNIVIT